MKPESLQATRDGLKTFYAGMRASMMADDDMFHRRYKSIVTVEYDIPIYESSLPTNIVESYRNQINTDAPSITFRPYSKSRKAQTHATLMQKWGYAALRRERRRSLQDPNAQCGFDLLLRGAAAKKIVLDVEQLPSKPKSRRGQAWVDYEATLADLWPFVSRVVDPLNFYPCPGYTTPLPYAVEEQTRTVGDIMASYPGWSDPKGRQLRTMGDRSANNPARVVEWIEYWSAPTYQDGVLVEPGYYMAEADGERVIDTNNPYGIVPYIFEYSGLGRSNYDADPSSLAVGILTEIRGDLAEEVRLMTAASVGTQMHIFPTILTTENEEDVARRFGVGPGRVIAYPSGAPKPEYMQPPPPNQNVFLLLDRIRANIARVANPAIQGTRTPGVDFGILNAQMIGQALTTIRPVRDTMNRIGTHTLNMMARMMLVMQVDMMVEGGSKDPPGDADLVRADDFGYFNFDVEFEVVDPTLNDRMLLIGEALRRNGDITQRTLWAKFAGHIVEDPDKEEAGLWAERLLMSLFQSGALMELVMGDVQASLAEEQVGGVVDQTRRQVEQVAGRERASEATSGTPGALTEIRASAQQASIGAAGGTP